MKKTNSEPLQEAKTTAAAVCEEKPNAGGPSRTNPLTRTIAVVIFAICILSLELPWLLNHPSGLKLSLLLATAISGGLLFGFGLTMPDEHKKDQDSGEDNDINGWPLAGLYLILSISVGLIYYYCPGMRISGWLYVLINLGEALIAGLFGGFFYELSAIVGKAARPLVILPGIAAAAGAVYLGWPLLQNHSSPVLALLMPGIALAGAAVSGLFVCFFFELSSVAGKAARLLAILLAIAVAAGAVYLGWPLLQNHSSPVLALLLPGIVLAEAAVSGLFAWFYISLVLIAGGHSIRERTAALGILLAVGAAAGAVYLGWPFLQNLSSPVLTLLLPGIILCGSVLVGMIGILVFLPEVFIGITRGLKQGIQKGRKVN